MKEKPVYQKIADYVIENNTSWSQTCENFELSRTKLSSYIYYLKTMDQTKHEQVVKILNTNEYNTDDGSKPQPLYLSIADYIIENNATRQQTCEHFEIHNTRLNSMMVYLSNVNKEKYSKVLEIFYNHRMNEPPKTLNELYEKSIHNKENFIVGCIVNKQFTINELCEHLKININEIFLYCLYKKMSNHIISTGE